MKITDEIRLKKYEQFTNLVDGKVKANISVHEILDFIESNGKKIQKTPTGIEQRFFEDMIDEQVGEMWDEWESDHNIESHNNRPDEGDYEAGVSNEFY